MTNANKITICFKSEILLKLIGIIQVSLFISTTNFYIVNTPILLFLSLKNINILSIYLNNITN